ncbi:hypothetical protein [Bradyrhizobium neotropicale]|uniref:hypothetical protein n=1 Tax=Bradyrhizobium neotropicale TaxID=1497615 RepID=UPI001AD71EFA|nr:hypothetical protein [Bradyrhizobium neotropicale]MBO4228047.1 hypothetical protein [Bradyrhizobium neotropicale]
MPIEMTLRGASADEFLSELRGVLPALVAGTSLPPMQEQPKENREPAPAEPKQRKPRGASAKDAAAEKVVEADGTVTKDREAGEAKSGEPSADTAAPGEKEASEAATSTSAPAVSEQAKAEEIPDIEDVRARLKKLGATDGFGHDKVFEVLGRYGATNASSVPTEKRAALIAEIDELLAKGAK